MEAAVATCSIGDVPESVGSSGVLQRTAAQGVGVTQRVKCTVSSLCRVGILFYPFAVLEDGFVQSVFQIAVFFLFGVFGFQVFIGNGIQQAGAVNADSRFQADFVVAYFISFVGYVDGTLRYAYFGITELVSLAIGELGFRPAEI